VKVFNFRLVQNFIKQFCTIVLFCLPAFSAFAYGSSRPLISYFTNNIVFHVLYSGGYFTLAILITLIIISYFSKKFKQVFLSFSLAIFGLLLLTFIYEALEDLEFIPSTYR
jgi:hypothetical protein